MSTFLENLIDATNYGLTENGAVKHNTTKSAILDMFALCGAYRNRSNADCILAFQNALVEDEVLAQALKDSPNIRQALIKVGLTPKGGNYTRARELIEKYKIEHLYAKTPKDVED